MDIVAIESKTFEQMKQRFADFSQQIKNLYGENQDKEKWLGNDDVCELLQISKRTLTDKAFSPGQDRGMAQAVPLFQ